MTIDWSNVVEWLKFSGTTFGYGLLGGLAGIVLFYAGLCILGFTCWGIAAGTCAACCQSGIGDVGAGSCFACFQSIGACGQMIFTALLFAAGFTLTVTLLIMHKVNNGGSEEPTNSTMATILVNGTRVFDLVN